MSSHVKKQLETIEEIPKKKKQGKKYRLQMKDNLSNNLQQMNIESESQANTSKSNIAPEISPFFIKLQYNKKEASNPKQPVYVSQQSQNYKQLRIRARNQIPQQKQVVINSFAETNTSSNFESRASIISESSKEQTNQIQNKAVAIIQQENKEEKKQLLGEENKNYNTNFTEATFDINAADYYCQKKNQKKDESYIINSPSKIELNFKKQNIEQDELKSPFTPFSPYSNSPNKRNKKIRTISKTLLKAAIGQQLERSQIMQNSITSPLTPARQPESKNQSFLNFLSPLQSPNQSPVKLRTPQRVHNQNLSQGVISEARSILEDSDDDELPDDPANNLGDFVKFQKAMLLSDIVQRQGKNLSSLDQEIIEQQRIKFSKSFLNQDLQQMTKEQRIKKATRHLRDTLYQRTCRFDIKGGFLLKIFEFQTNPKWITFCKLASIVYLLLPFWAPVNSRDRKDEKWSNNWNNLLITESVLIFVFFSDFMLHWIHLQSNKQYCKSKIFILNFILFFITFVDFVVYISIYPMQYFRVDRLTRPLWLVLYYKGLRETVVAILGTFTKMFEMGILYASVVLVFGVLALRLIGINQKSYDEFESNFTDMSHSTHLIFALMTLNGYPGAPYDIIQDTGS